MRKAQWAFAGYTLIIAAGCGTTPAEDAEAPGVVKTMQQAPPTGPGAAPVSTKGPVVVGINLNAWRSSMASVPLPSVGCFKASYPSLTWQSVGCVTAPMAPMTVGGGGTHDSSFVSSTPISKAIGSFDSVTGVTKESGPSGADAFSLQLNSNEFDSFACASAQDPSICQGWQQFVFVNSGDVFMQYWLLNFGPCQPGWSQYQNHCWTNSDAVRAGSFPITSLANLSITGWVNPDWTDNLIFSPGGANLFAVKEPSVLGLQQGWREAEFNVFGDSNGNEATFNSGSTIVVRTAVNNGTADPPRCDDASFTGETNNLSMLACCPSWTSALPAIVATESNAGGSAPSCTCPPGSTLVSSSSGATCVCTSATQILVGGQCQSCGQPGEPCCSGSTCSSGSGCAPATNTCVACSPSATRTAAIQSFHLGNNCFGSYQQATVSTTNSAGACDATFRRKSCSVLLTSLPNGSTGTATWQDPCGDTNCNCVVNLSTPKDCSKWADFTVIVTETTDPPGCP